MVVSDPWMPLLVSALKDAIIHNEERLKSEDLLHRADYEEHLVQLSQFFEHVKAEYRAREREIGLPLQKLLER